jgi:hypothetical protein
MVTKTKRTNIKTDLKQIINDCEFLCYLKGDDFGDFPIKKINKKRLVDLIIRYFKERSNATNQK